MTETGKELIPQSGGIVSPAVTPEQAIKRWEDYLELKRLLLVEDDYQAYTGGKKLPKKSGWRKLATAFNLTDELVGEPEIRRDTKQRPVSVRYEVRVTASNGRSAIGVHGAHVNERCCPAADGEPCPNKDREQHECCPVGCSGWRHWSHPDDVIATAHTRAKNRAISDLVGGGEISAEEMKDGIGSSSTPHVAPMGLCPVHKVPFVERTGPRGKFWACPERPGGQFCKERPKVVESQKVEASQSQTQGLEIEEQEPTEGHMVVGEGDLEGQAPPPDRSATEPQRKAILSLQAKLGDPQNVPVHLSVSGASEVIKRLNERLGDRNKR